MAIHAVGLEPAVGFLHDFSNYQTKQSLVYDLQEPFRWLVDLSVIEAFESGALELHDFYFTGDDYRYRFELDAKTRFIEVLCEQFNSGVKYDGRVMKWDTVIQRKATELGRYLIGKSPLVDFSGPPAEMARSDDREFRAKVIALTQFEAGKRGIGRSTLHYLRKRAIGPSAFKAYLSVRKKIQLLSR